MKRINYKSFVSCKRCEKDNFKDPSFESCGRFRCEVEESGRIIETREVLKD